MDDALVPLATDLSRRAARAEDKHTQKNNRRTNERTNERARRSRRRVKHRRAIGRSAPRQHDPPRGWFAFSGYLWSPRASYSRWFERYGMVISLRVIKKSEPGVVGGRSRNGAVARAVCVYSDVWVYLHIPGLIDRSVLLFMPSMYLRSICPLATDRSIDRSI